MDGLILTVDIGSTKISALAVDRTKNCVAAEANCPTGERLRSEISGAAEWSAESIRNRVFETLRKLADSLRGKTIDGIVLTGQQHGVVLVDRGEQTKPLGPFISWMDQRGELPYDSNGISVVDEARRRVESATDQRLGFHLAAGYAGVTLFSLLKNKSLPANGRALFITDFLNVSLCGVKKLPTDPTMAAGSGLFDVENNCWSESAFDALGIPRSLFPRIEPCGTRLGELSDAAAKEAGLSPGIPIYLGLGDNQASILGCLGADKEYRPAGPFSNKERSAVIVNYGTGSQVTVLSDQFIRETTMETRPFPGGGFILVRAETGGGRSFALLRRFFGESGKQLFDVKEPEDLYDRLDALAEPVPAGSRGLRIEPDFFPSRRLTESNGEKTPHGGTIFGLTEDNFTPACFVRALFEGMAERSFCGAASLRQAANRSMNESELNIYGGGNLIRRSAVFQKILSGRFGAPVRLTPFTEEAAFGVSRVVPE